MSEESAVDLFDLLPSLYKLKDKEQGGALEALLDIISMQADILKKDINGLWDDLFIETCADWVIPYIGDLVGNNPLHEVAQRRRIDVAKTIYYRRRKGTLPMLEELARDVTGWSAHAVAFFELLGWTQNLNHLRYNMAANSKERDPNSMDRVGTVNLRNLDALDRLDGPFDIISHTVDLRPIGRTDGWHNIRKIGFFLWRLKSYPLTGVIPCKADNNFGFHFSPLGNPAPLFNNRPVREADEAGLAGEVHVPGPIRPAAFHFNIADYYGPDKSLAIYKVIEDENRLIPSDRIVCKDLSSWSQPENGKVAVDVRLGRIAFPSDEVPDDKGIYVYYNYGFSSDIGGGPYDRLEKVADQAMVIWKTTIARENANYASISNALNAWTPWAEENDGESRYAVITLMDNGTYEEEIEIDAVDSSRLVIQVGKDHAGNRFRPVLKGNIALRGDHPYASLSLNGLLIEGGIDVQGSLGKLEVNHCTLVPGGSLTAEGEPNDSDHISVQAADSNERLEVEISSSISGKIRLPAEMRSLTIRDSIVDAFGGLAITGHDIEHGPPTTIERTTVLGEVRVKELSLASESIFSGNVESLRKQSGCVRFCYLPDIGSQTPRRYRCQPDLAMAGLADPEKALVRARLVPSFTSKSYGVPGYCQLSLNCPHEIRTGAENGSEMGAFCRLMQPQREMNLRIRLAEYLPFGLEAGIIYVT